MNKSKWHSIVDFFLRERGRSRGPVVPRVYWGFPVDSETNNAPLQSKPERSRGVALLMAVLIISTMMLFATDLILTSSVQLELSQRQKDNNKADYIAKSALNLAVLTVTADLAKDLFLAGPQSPQKAEPGDSGIDFWNSLNAIPPIGGENAAMVGEIAKSFGLSAVMDSNILDQLKLFEGQFKAEVSDETHKINLNYCSNRSLIPCSMVKLMLKALFSCPPEKAWLEHKKIKPNELVGRIADWITNKPNAEEESNLSDKNEPYQKMQPPYNVKNAPYDTLDELRMVDGWDEDMTTVFSSYLTVYPVPKDNKEKPRLNLSTIPSEMLQCLFPESRGEQAQKLILAMKSRDDDGNSLLQAGQKIPDALRELTGYTPPGASDGKNLDDGTDKSKWFTKTSQVYRIVATGSSGDSERKITAVVERIMPDAAKNQKSSYRFLFYRVQ